MGRPSTVVNRILPVLMLFLEQGRRLPSTSGGKVNVDALCRELHAIDPSRVKGTNDAQHLFNKADLRDRINDEAAEQGLLPIGHGAPTAEEAEELEKRLQQATKQANEDARATVEATAAQEALMEELNQVKAELEDTKLQRNALKERLRLIEENGFFIPLDPAPRRRDL